MDLRTAHRNFMKCTMLSCHQEKFCDSSDAGCVEKGHLIQHTSRRRKEINKRKKLLLKGRNSLHAFSQEDFFSCFPNHQPGPEIPMLRFSPPTSACLLNSPSCKHPDHHLIEINNIHAIFSLDQNI